MAQNLDRTVEREPYLPRQGGNANNSAFYVRETYNNFFNSDIAGSLAWQRGNIV